MTNENNPLVPGIDLDVELASKIAGLITEGADDKQPDRAISILIAVSYSIGALSPIPQDRGLEMINTAVKIAFRNGVKLREATLAQQEKLNPLEKLAKEWEQRKDKP